MQNYFQREAITATKKMIRAFYVFKNVEGALEIFNRDNLIVIGIGENNVFNSFDEVRNYFYKYADAVTSAYKIISKDYRVDAASYDSCIVVAKIGFQADEAHFNHQVYLHFSFYFQLIDDKLFITFAHIHIPEKISDEKFSK